MAEKFKIIGLGNPAAAVTAVELLKDKDVRQTVTLPIKIGGAIIGGLTLFFVGKWAVKKIKDRSAAKDVAKGAEAQVIKENLTYSEKEYKAIAAALKVAMKDSDYQEETIEAQLRKIKNQDDWNKVIAAYGVDSNNLDLNSALAKDGWWDLRTYREILTNANVVPEF